MLKWLGLSFLVVLLDQVSKYWANVELVKHKPIEFLPMVDLTLTYNPGAAFSFLSQAGGWQRWVFSLIAVVVSVFIVLWIKNLKQHERLQAISLALILGGALGNVIDRLFLGHVIDFVDFHYLADQCLPLFAPVNSPAGLMCHWPAFNIADSAISIGVVLMLFDGIKSALKRKPQTHGTNDLT